MHYSLGVVRVILNRELDLQIQLQIWQTKFSIKEINSHFPMKEEKMNFVIHQNVTPSYSNDRKHSWSRLGKDIRSDEERGMENQKEIYLDN